MTTTDTATAADRAAESEEQAMRRAWRRGLDSARAAAVRFETAGDRLRELGRSITLPTLPDPDPAEWFDEIAPDAGVDPGAVIGHVRAAMTAMYALAHVYRRAGDRLDTSLRGYAAWEDTEQAPVARPTLAQTRTGTDWCPTCQTEPGTDRIRDDGGTECCGTCGTVLVSRDDGMVRLVAEWTQTAADLERVLSTIDDIGRLAGAWDGETAAEAIRRVVAERDYSVAQLKGILRLTGRRLDETVVDAVKRIVDDRDYYEGGAEHEKERAEAAEKIADNRLRDLDALGHDLEKLWARTEAAEKLAADRGAELDEVSAVLTQLRAELQRRGMEAAS